MKNKKPTPGRKEKPPSSPSELPTVSNSANENPANADLMRPQELHNAKPKMGPSEAFKVFFRDPNHIIALGTIFLVLIGIGALWLSRDSERRQLRAYVYVVPEITDFVVGQQPAVGVTIKNDGQTPAYNFNVALQAQIRPFPQTGPIRLEGIELSPATPTGDGFGSFSYREHDIRISLPQRAPTINAQTFEGKTQRLYVWGRVLYLDAFNISHHVNFCMTFDGESIRQNLIHYCRDYNDTD